MKSIFFLFLLLVSFSFKRIEPSLPGVRAHHALIYDELNNKVVLFGGSTPLDGGNSFKIYNDMWSFDGVKWTLIGNIGEERSSLRLAYDTKRNKIYSFGGFDGKSIAEFRVLENNQWTKLEAPALITAESGFVYDSDHDKFIAFGGSSAPGIISKETWEWDGNSWKKFEGTGPEGRQAFVMVYDEARRKTLLFGGSVPGTMFGDTWEFDGNAWQKVSETGPAPRASAGYAYDSDKKLLIIFGGLTKNGFTNDTWSWNGKDWKQLSSEGPAARAMGYLAYDKARKKMIMFGGRLGWPNDANDTWEWDGKQWKELHF